ncbi:MAG: hypothetical protein J0H00_00850 [Burkholderiales bacterium]|jgi:cystathionine gamma-lyase|nr:hypothetical protein [Burkholderiales bacterium]MBW7925911.1 hypothetical protein [Burkholderiaceae bacterium]HLT25902.1 hypothetical protein [Zeimonas sp.]HQW10322.1 hypothetical protein [Steroidobacteraceae bacterium]MCL4700884.1 hypothetical protein [Burkholderiaceae bacterium]
MSGSTVMELLNAGAQVVAGDDLYGEMHYLLERVRRESAGVESPSASV